MVTFPVALGAGESLGVPIIGTVAGPAGLRLVYVANPSSVHVRRWTRFFAERGHDVSILDGFGSPIDPELDQRVRVLRYDPRGLRGVLFSGMLRARHGMRDLVRELAPDVVHAHSARRYAWHALLGGHHPYVVSVWGSDVLLPDPSWRGRLLTRLALGSADLVTGVTTHTLDAAVARGARPERTIQIHHGVDTDRFHPGPLDAATRTRLGVGDVPYVFSPRALRPLYNHETIVNAVADLATPHRLVMTSAGAEATYRATLERLARSKLGERFVVLPAPSETDLAEVYRGADVVVSAALSDSFPLTIQEAMASGTPVVAGDLPPIRAVLGALAPNALVPPTDAGAMHAAIERAIGLAPDERHQLGERLRGWVVEHADWRQHMGRMEKYYRRLAGRG